MNAITQLTILCFFYLSATAVFGQIDTFWLPLNGPRGSNEIQLLDRDVENHWFVLMNDTMYRSDNQGYSWIKAGEGIPNFYSVLNKGQFFSGKSGQLFFQNGIKSLYKYSNVQNRWTSVDFPGSIPDKPQTFNIDTSGRFWIMNGITAKKVYYSENEGTTFSEVLLNQQVEGSLRRLRSLDENHQLVLSSTGLYHFDAAGTVVPVASNIPQITYFGYNPHTGTAYYINDFELFRSTDGGFTWKMVLTLPAQQSNMRENEMIFDASGSIWAITEDSRIYKSTDDGLTWTQSSLLAWPNRFIKLTDGDWFQVNQDCSGYAFAKSADEGSTWIDLADAFAFPKVVDWLKDSNQNLYAKTCRRNGYEWSTDDGQTWNTIYIQDGAPVEVHALTMTTTGIAMASGKNGRFYRSYNNGVDWEEITNLPVVPAPFFVPTRFLQGFHGDIYLFGLGDVLKTTDNGASWQSISIPKLANDVFSFSISIHPNGDIFYGSYSHTGVYKAQSGTTLNIPLFGFLVHCTADGYTYMASYFPIPVDVYRIAPNGNYSPELVYPNAGVVTSISSNVDGHVFLANDNSLLKSDDNGISWTAIASLPPGAAKCNLFVTPDQFIYASFDNKVVHRSKTGTVSTQPEAVNPISLTAYPNPFTEKVTFKLSGLNTTDDLTLRLFDGLGRLVRLEVFNGVSLMMERNGLAPGLYCFLLEGENGFLASGTLVVE